jgi:hypothetical protein
MYLNVVPQDKNYFFRGDVDSIDYRIFATANEAKEKGTESFPSLIL